MELDEFIRLQALRDEEREKREQQYHDSQRNYHEEKYSTIFGKFEELTQAQNTTNETVRKQGDRLTTVETTIRERSDQVRAEIQELKKDQSGMAKMVAANASDISANKSEIKRNSKSLRDAHKRINGTGSYRIVSDDQEAEGWSAQKHTVVWTSVGTALAAAITGLLKALGVI